MADPDPIPEPTQAELYPEVLDPAEYDQLRHNIAVMVTDVEILHKRAAESTVRGRPVIIQRVADGGRGQPRVEVDPVFLAWAYTQRTTSGIAHYLGISRPTVRRLLLEYGITAPGENPFAEETDEEGDSPTAEEPMEDTGEPSPGETEDFLNIDQNENQDNDQSETHSSRSLPAYLSTMTDDKLDVKLIQLRAQYPQAGIGTIQGMLRTLGHIVQYHRIRNSLLRTDPIHRVFQRILIRRRIYKVPGPNFLCHHDGHHALIRWGIVIHGFINGYSRMVTALRAANNNYPATVLVLFWEAAREFGIPARVRGDHGVENTWLAAFIELTHGVGKGSYIWGRSVHNVRIERLWVDVRVNISSVWDARFTDLEMNCGLDIHKADHIWLLHTLFLPYINESLEFWRRSWNNHKIATNNGRRSPEDMFGFDMLLHGFRGEALQDMTEEELEVFGVDWEALHDDGILRTLRQNYIDQEDNSWIGRRGPPPPSKLNKVEVNPPPCALPEEKVAQLLHHVANLPCTTREDDVRSLWLNGLAFARYLDPNAF